MEVSGYYIAADIRRSQSRCHPSSKSYRIEFRFDTEGDHRCDEVVTEAVAVCHVPGHHDSHPFWFGDKGNPLDVPGDLRNRREHKLSRHKPGLEVAQQTRENIAALMISRHW